MLQSVIKLSCVLLHSGGRMLQGGQTSKTSAPSAESWMFPLKKTSLFADNTTNTTRDSKDVPSDPCALAQSCALFFFRAKVTKRQTEKI